MKCCNKQFHIFFVAKVDSQMDSQMEHLCFFLDEFMQCDSYLRTLPHKYHNHTFSVSHVQLKYVSLNILVGNKYDRKDILCFSFLLLMNCFNMSCQISFNKHHNYESSFPHELIQCVVSICILIKGTSTIATDVWFYFIMNKFNVNCQTVLLCEVSFTNIAHKRLFLSMNFYSASLDNFTVLLCSLDNFTVLA